MTVEEMKKKKTELGFSCEQISDRSGVPLGTVQDIQRNNQKTKI